MHRWPKTEVQKTLLSSKLKRIILRRLQILLQAIARSRQNDRLIRLAVNMKKLNLHREQSRKLHKQERRRIIKWWSISNPRSKFCRILERCKRQMTIRQEEWIFKNTTWRWRNTKLLSKKDPQMTSWQFKGPKCSFSFHLRRKISFDKAQTTQRSLLALERRE